MQGGRKRGRERVGEEGRETKRGECICVYERRKKETEEGEVEWESEERKIRGEGRTRENGDCLLYTSPSPRDGLLS
eukprot:6175074-Pleurochrysis_carterae.AAC.1